MSQVRTFSAVNDGHSSEVARILVVDDEEYMCDICTRTLRNASYEVVPTTNANVALQELREGGPFDLLLADIKMPTISGLELAKYAREIDPAIAIIIMTGHTSTENLRQAVQRGAADFISKPFELEELRLAVDQALHKRLLLQDSLRLRAVEQLLQSSEAINATLDRPQLSRVILQTALRQTACQTGFLFLVDSRNRLRKVRAADEVWHLLEAGRDAAHYALAKGQTFFIEDKAICSDGTNEITRGLAMPLRAQGDMVGVLLLCDNQPGVLRPGTHEVIALLANHAGIALRNAHLYGQLQHMYQRLQELDQLKSEFIAIASHELRTPLSIVLGYSMMVRDQSEGDQREYAQRVVDSAQRIKDIVDDMLSLRHLEMRETTLSINRCNLQHLVLQAVERMQPIAQSKAQEMTAELPESPVTFLADREKILLVLGNLISNATKFTPEKGKIVVKAALWPGKQVLEVAQHTGGMADTAPTNADGPDETWIVMQVCDTGIGIPAHEQPRIFERFYQVAASLTRQQGGAGLGLAIVRELTALQGGLVWVESVEGQGSTFSFALPYRIEQNNESHLPAPRPETIK